MIPTRAALVERFDRPPRFLPHELVDPAEGEELVEVVAAGLHPRVRSAAAGTHYTSSGRLPLVPGVDGIGRRADGTLVYFVVGDDREGSMAAHAVVDPRRSVPLPPGADVVRLAALMNPAMSSWVALRRRVSLVPGASVLILGATGSAGGAAVGIARLLGAGRVVAAGRNRDRLEALRERGADEVVALEAGRIGDLARAAADVDVVLDYLWGEPAQAAIPAILRARTDRSRPLDWVEIGSMAGPDITLPSAALRSAHLRLLGSGQGSIGVREYVAELPSLVAAIQDGSVAGRVRTAPLAEVERVWTEPEEPGVRTVLVT